MVNAPKSPPPQNTQTAPHLLTGAHGEDAAAEYLTTHGYKILDRNWQCQHVELDIVAQQDDMIVFVEVKTRTAGGLSAPYEALTHKKQERLQHAATLWLQAHKAWQSPCRFDLICVHRLQEEQTAALTKTPINVSGNASGNAPTRTSGNLAALWQKWRSRFSASQNIASQTFTQQIFILEHIQNAFEFSQSVGHRHTAWQPW